MVRLLTLVVLLFCLGWQLLASTHAAVAPQGAGELAHVTLHWSEEAHHHHDGDIHLDDSEESVSHVIADQMGTCIALPYCATSLGERSASDVLPITPQEQVSAPFLDGLLRPPRA